MGKKQKKQNKKKNRPLGLRKETGSADKTKEPDYDNLNAKVLNLLRSQGIDPEKIDFVDKPDAIKMSAVILDLVEPYLKKYWGNENRVRGLISLAVAAWNMSFLSNEQQMAFQEKLITKAFPKDSDAKDVAMMLSFFAELQQRQRKLFPDIRSIIIGHDLDIDINNIHLNVSSVPIDRP
ncbi:MAG: hypothetical protein GY846_26050 [Deltaproteobacteria bacterium]|nr:hypothetical protein [Deltaproteobacteria bacterium]